MELKELSTKYLESLPYKQGTIKSYGGRIDAFLNCGGAPTIRYVADLNESRISEYQKYLADNKVSINTQYVYLETLGKFLKYLYENNYSFLNLSRCIELPKWERKEKKGYTSKEIELMLDSVNEPEPFKSRSRAIIILYALERFKTSEIKSLTVMDVDVPVCELRLGKRKAFRKVEKRTIELIQKYLYKRNQFKPKCDYLFVDRMGKQLDGQVIARVWKETQR